jgi:hypothetical protein
MRRSDRCVKIITSWPRSKANVRIHAVDLGSVLEGVTDFVCGLLDLARDLVGASLSL